MLSLVIGLAICYPLGVADVIINPLLVAIILSSTSLGIVAPVLKDTGLLDTTTGRYVIAACSVAEFAAIVVLSMFFTQTGTADPLVTIVKLAGLAVIVVVIGSLATRPGTLARSRSTTCCSASRTRSAQLRVRGAMLLMIALVVLSEGLKFDAILGSFLAGAMLAAVTDPDARARVRSPPAQARGDRLRLLRAHLLHLDRAVVPASTSSSPTRRRCCGSPCSW